MIFGVLILAIVAGAFLVFVAYRRQLSEPGRAGRRSRCI